MKLIEVFGAKNRIRIIRELTRKDMYVNELIDSIGMDGSTALYHLNTLEEAGLIASYRVGRRKYYTLTASLILKASPPPNREFILQAIPIKEQKEKVEGSSNRN
ncbi:MAG: winged helix-turn-helix transcriptional regulator [Candidatus Korarchaeota archaeon]|nr:winged helix-turn-helix transcriptional regulator [Candidatus Korarchaeota archaeon]NIU82175.1 metalloregulator ArsR/SmtB family transcription factor [Candidatus Thorarchaeota archaeon]NIW12646.1 metalloregulator ArsR/SmtB family transcription factor [Candidatus Thorarchaeota archaeon]NIW50851.1 metalloregulator ArsR/SmtB family transcription factor [Candidatus Korarchaeota archaeon]